MSSTTHVTLTPLLVGTLAAGLTIYASVPAPEAAPAPRPHVCSLRPALGLSQVLDAPGVRVLAGQATLDAEQRVILGGAELLQGAPLAGSDVELHLAPASVNESRLWLVVADGAGHVDLWTSLRDRPESRAYLAAAADSTPTLAAIRAALAAGDLPGLRELAALDLERELKQGRTLSVGDATALLATLVELPQGDAGRQIALRAVCRALPDDRALGLRLLEAAQADPTLVGSLAEDLAEGGAERPALRQVLVEEALEQRAVAVDLLAHLGGEEGQRALRTAVTSDDPAQQAAAFLAFSGSDVAEVESAAQVVVGAALLPQAAPAPATELEKILAQRALNALKQAPNPEQKRLMAAGYYLLRVPGGADQENWLSERLPRLADRAVAAFLAERAGQRWQPFDAAW